MPSLLPTPLTGGAIFNLMEALLWVAVAAAIAWKEPRRWGLVLAFAMFGVSDWIEAHTGAWWRPWSLLALKTVCVGVIVPGLYRWWQAGRKR